jgi:hypothetical protein
VKLGQLLTPLYHTSAQLHVSECEWGSLTCQVHLGQHRDPGFCLRGTSPRPIQKAATTASASWLHLLDLAALGTAVRIHGPSPSDGTQLRGSTISSHSHGPMQRRGRSSGDTQEARLEAAVKRQERGGFTDLLHRWPSSDEILAIAGSRFHSLHHLPDVCERIQSCWEGTAISCIHLHGCGWCERPRQVWINKFWCILRKGFHIHQ